MSFFSFVLIHTWILQTNKLQSVSFCRDVHTGRRSDDLITTYHLNYCAAVWVYLGCVPNLVFSLFFFFPQCISVFLLSALSSLSTLQILSWGIQDGLKIESGTLYTLHAQWLPSRWCLTSDGTCFWLRSGQWSILFGNNSSDLDCDKRVARLTTTTSWQ